MVYPVDPAISVPRGSGSFQVAVCATDSPSAIAGLSFNVVYNDNNLAAPEIGCGNNGDLTSTSRKGALEALFGD